MKREFDIALHKTNKMKKYQKFLVQDTQQKLKEKRVLFEITFEKLKHKL